MTIQGMSDKVQKLDLRKEVVEIIKETSFDIEALNKKQLYGGLDVYTRKIEPYKSDSYAKFKNQMNPSPGLGIKDYFLTGAFYKGFYVDVKNDAYIVGSNDSKASKIERNAAQGNYVIYGLTKDNKRVYATGIFYDKLRQYITQTTGLIFR